MTLIEQLELLGKTGQNKLNESLKIEFKHTPNTIKCVGIHPAHDDDDIEELMPKNFGT